MVLGTLQDGVLVSRDDGATWTTTLDDPGLGPVTAMQALAKLRTAMASPVESRAATIVWSTGQAPSSWVRIGGRNGSFGPPTCWNSHRSSEPMAIWRSGDSMGCCTFQDDHGETWRAVWSGLDGSDFLALAYSPNFGQDRAMAAAAGDAQRLVVIRSNDAGDTWTPWVEYDTSLGWASLAILSIIQAGRRAITSGRTRPNSYAAVVGTRAVAGNAGCRRAVWQCVRSRCLQILRTTGWRRSPPAMAYIFQTRKVASGRAWMGHWPDRPSSG